MCVCVYSICVYCDEALICDLPPDQGDLDGLCVVWVRWAGCPNKDVRHHRQVWDCCASCDMTGKHTNTHTHTANSSSLSLHLYVCLVPSVSDCPNHSRLGTALMSCQQSEI